MAARKSEADKVRPVVADALDGAEAMALPFLDEVNLEAWTALRSARDAVRDDLPHPPGPEAVKEDIEAFEAACEQHCLKSTDEGSSYGIVKSALLAGLMFAAGEWALARREADKVRRRVNEWRRAERERERERTLLAYQEAFWALRRGELPVRLASSEGERRVEVEVLGAGRVCGGVVIVGDAGVLMADDWCAAQRRHPDVYVQDLARQVARYIGDAQASAAEATRRGRSGEERGPLPEQTVE